MIVYGTVVTASFVSRSSAEPLQSTGVETSIALSLLEKQMRHVFSDVSHIEPEVVSQLIGQRSDHILILDARTQAEFAVSRIQGAVRVDPDTRSARSVTENNGDLQGKTVIVYCSIGLRSSRLVVRIGQALKDNGVTAIHNMSGGIFRWRNEHRAIVDADGATRAIDSYNILWRQFLTSTDDMTSPNLTLSR